MKREILLWFLCMWRDLDHELYCSRIKMLWQFINTLICFKKYDSTAAGLKLDQFIAENGDSSTLSNWTVTCWRGSWLNWTLLELYRSNFIAELNANFWSSPFSFFHVVKEPWMHLASQVIMEYFEIIEITSFYLVFNALRKPYLPEYYS